MARGRVARCLTTPVPIPPRPVSARIRPRRAVPTWVLGRRQMLEISSIVIPLNKILFNAQKIKLKIHCHLNNCV